MAMFLVMLRASFCAVCAGGGFGLTLILIGNLSVASVCWGQHPPPKKEFSAEQFARKTIYHSPQTPGYTCWVGAWIMPDKSFMVTFAQATGPVEDRLRASKELLDRLGRAGAFIEKDPQRDFTGLRLANVYLRSIDGGTTWEKVGENSFSSPLDRPVHGPATVALLDGAILRVVDGSGLPLTPDLPRRIYFQRSTDLGKTWG